MNRNIKVVGHLATAIGPIPALASNWEEATVNNANSTIDVDKYLNRIGLSQAPPLDRDGLAQLQRAHLATVPFENLDVVAGIEVRTDTMWSYDKVVNRRRGGWCFELNGAFGALLTALGFEILQIPAAVLLSGPTKIVDHLALEVLLDQPYLVDVGFGESFVAPLELNQDGPQVDPAGVFELIGSPEGTTLTWHDAEGVPLPQYRFKRIHHELTDFEPASERLRTDPTLDWSSKPFATRLLDASTTGSAKRVTLTHDKSKTHGDGTTTERPVDQGEWNDVLAELFALESPL